MLVKYLLPALAAISSVASQSATCTVSTTTVNSQADATKLADCGTVKGSIVIGSQAGSDIDISGPQEITGDLTVENNGALQTFKSNRLETIGGKFTLKNVTRLSILDFSGLSKVKSLAWQSVTGLTTLNLGPLTQAEDVTLSDTLLNNLDAFALTSVDKLDINNNRLLTKFSGLMKSMKTGLNINDNGRNLEIDLPNLVWIVDMAISKSGKLSIPSLKVVNGSMRFDSNAFSSFTAPNLTNTEKGDISFVGNSELTNMTLPKLTSIGGGLLVANNTRLNNISAFSQLKTVGGAIKLRGNFTDADFPALDIVKGAFDVSSTADIKPLCDKLKNLAPRSQGGDGKVQGVFSCTGNNQNANQDTSSNTSSSGNIDGTGKNGASGIVFNTALFSLVAVAAVASAL